MRPPVTPVAEKSGSMVVMVADDDDELRVILVEALQADGHSTIEAHDGQELLELLERDRGAGSSLRPDVLVTDVKMPKLSGLGVLAALRGAQWGLAVVVVTALLDESIDTLAKRLGAVEVLHKPFSCQELLAAVRNARRYSRPG
jgi:DNA-binding response OmpR family regulator